MRQTDTTPVAQCHLCGELGDWRAYFCAGKHVLCNKCVIEMYEIQNSGDRTAAMMIRLREYEKKEDATHDD